VSGLPEGRLLLCDRAPAWSRLRLIQLRQVPLVCVEESHGGGVAEAGGATLLDAEIYSPRDQGGAENKQHPTGGQPS